MERCLFMRTGVAALLVSAASTALQAEDRARELIIEAEINGSGYLAEIGFGSLWSMIEDKLAHQHE